MAAVVWYARKGKEYPLNAARMIVLFIDWLRIIFHNEHFESETAHRSRQTARPRV